MATMTDVAKAAKVSVMTVSRVLNNSGYVKKETREAIEKAIDELGYRPNLVAKSLVTGRSSLIAYVLSDISDPFYGSVCKGVENACFTNGYTALICNANTPNSIHTYIDRIIDRKLDGVIFHHMAVTKEQTEKLAENGIQCVTVDNEITLDEVSSVDSDDYMGAVKAVRYLKKLGYRNIGCICGEDINMNNSEKSYLEQYQHKIWSDRTRGYVEEMQENGTFSGEIFYGRGSAEMQVSAESGRKIALEILESGKKIDALYCQSDIIASGVANVFYQQHSMEHPIAVMGHDGLDICRLFYPRITTVVQPKYEMGMAAVELLLKKITKPDSVPEHKIVESYIFEGDTAGKSKKEI